MARCLALVFLGLSSPLLLVTSVLGGAWAEVVFVVVVMAFPVALIVFAIGRRLSIGPLAIPLLILLLIFEGCGLALLLQRGKVIAGPWLAGLPLAAAIQLWGLFLAPLLLVALAYALTFDRFGIRDDDLHLLRSLRRDREAEH